MTTPLIHGRDSADPDAAPDLAALTAAVRGPVYDGADPRVADEAATYNLAVRHLPAVGVGALRHAASTSARATTDRFMPSRRDSDRAGSPSS